ncbi:MAG TPA: hypothetical protein VGX23_21070 [Actinocrinis sp.]|nr:hypothetical protein [Actinocrinis sp.]
MSDQLQMPGQDAEEVGLDHADDVDGMDVDDDLDGDEGDGEDGAESAAGPWPGGLGQGAFARGEEVYDETSGGPGPRQSNRLAFAGFVLAVLFWPAGLVLSIIGLVKSRGLGGAGRMFAYFGLAVSVVFAVGTGVVIDHVVTSTAADPGCAAVESSAVSAHLAGLVHDDNALSKVENATTVVPTAVTAAIGAYVSDLKTYQSDLDHAVSVSRHATVRDAISAMDQNVGIVLAGYEALEVDDSSKSMEAMVAAGQLPANGSAIDNLCTAL